MKASQYLKMVDTLIMDSRYLFNGKGKFSDKLLQFYKKQLIKRAGHLHHGGILLARIKNLTDKAQEKEVKGALAVLTDLIKHIQDFKV